MNVVFLETDEDFVKLDACVAAQVLGIGFSWVEWASDNPHGYSLERAREDLAIVADDEDPSMSTCDGLEGGDDDPTEGEGYCANH